MFMGVYWRMTLKAAIGCEEFQTLSEPLQKEYQWRDGRYYLNALPVTFPGPDGKERTIAWKM